MDGVAPGPGWNIGFSFVGSLDFHGKGWWDLGGGGSKVAQKRLIQNDHKGVKVAKSVNNGVVSPVMQHKYPAQSRR